MPMYNLLEYSKNYKKTTTKKQKVCGVIIEMNQVILFLLILNILNRKQVLQEKTSESNDSLTNVKLVIPLKYLSNFWRV